MVLDLGPCKGTIVSHRSKMIGDKLAIAVRCEVIGGESAEAIIFITDKAMGMARRSLKVCGFDIDKQDLAMLDINGTLLAGNVVPLMVDEYNNKTQVKIDIDQRAEKSALDAATKALRAVKKHGGDDELSPPERSPAKGKKVEDYGDIPF